uniref:ribosomal protein S4 n=1 Tax=Mitrastemon yamamotoi TaxID=51498 RepID=UPI0026E39D27|nr:ribosomal protein S4 [Mitrastemon yamamotoi]USS57997.1 ribosomal protein S4 [Mitrastemon yamamotoi]
MPGLTNKCYKKKIFYNKKKSQYRLCLEEKQKLRFNYGLTDHQLRKYFNIAKNFKGSTGYILLQLIEMRLDNIIYQLKIAKTINEARQLINHRHILVNNSIVNIPSFHCKYRDIVKFKLIDKKKPLNLLNLNKNKGLIYKILDIKDKKNTLKIKELLIVEHYSR